MAFLVYLITLLRIMNLMGGSIGLFYGKHISHTKSSKYTNYVDFIMKKEFLALWSQLAYSLPSRLIIGLAMSFCLLHYDSDTGTSCLNVLLTT